MGAIILGDMRVGVFSDDKKQIENINLFVPLNVFQTVRCKFWAANYDTKEPGIIKGSIGHFIPRIKCNSNNLLDVYYTLSLMWLKRVGH